MYISYDYYRIFYYVARYGSITHAAKLLLNSQPNLTRAVKTLESELGCPLFIRNNRGMALTTEGERLFDRVAVAMENIEAGEAEIIASRNMEKGSVYVAASELALHCALLPVLKAYRAQHPGVRLKISNHSTPQAIDAIKNGAADIAVVTTPTVQSRSAATIRTYTVLRSCCASRSFRWERRQNHTSCIRSFSRKRDFAFSRISKPLRRIRFCRWCAPISASGSCRRNSLRARRTFPLSKRKSRFRSAKSGSSSARASR